MKYPRLEPWARKAIKAARKAEGFLVMMVDWFQTDDEALILRDMLWYARDKWVLVYIIPPSIWKK